MKTALYLVATPIGNLEDMTLRALSVLQGVEWVAAEDTRHSKRLLDHYGVKTRLISLHEHNEVQRVNDILALLKKEKSVAVISDAGTPLVSDPGYRLVVATHEAGIEVVPIPGPCSVIAALSASGLPTNRFVFEGFLPAKGERRLKQLQGLALETRTMVFFEAVHRIKAFIAELIEVFGEKRLVCVARELTKTYETIHRGELKHVQAWLLADANQQKGEFVVMVAGASQHVLKEALQVDHVLQTLLAELPLSQAVKIAQTLTGEGKSKLYQRALALK